MFEQLKIQHRTLREHFPADLNLRVHRALSWLQRAEMAEDEDGRFIFSGLPLMQLMQPK